MLSTINLEALWKSVDCSAIMEEGKMGFNFVVIGLSTKIRTWQLAS